MSIVDIIILSILGLSVLIGLYRGFISSVASLGGCVLSLGLSFWLNPRLFAWVQSNTSLVNTLLSYTDANTRIGDRTLAATNVSQLTGDMITNILTRVNLPAPLDSLLRSNLENQIFGPSNMTTVGDYVSQTIVGSVLNVICFLICFLVCFIVFHFVLNFLKAVFRFPVLKQLNSLVGGVFGLLRGALICFLAFALLPLVQTMVPIDGIDTLINESVLAPLFNSPYLITAIMNGRL